MDPATFALALFGAVAGGGSLAWNVWSFYLSGPKVAVRLDAGHQGPGGVLTRPLDGGTVVHHREDEYPEPVVVVVATNSGRSPISVTHWRIEFGTSSLTLLPGRGSPPLPHPLGVGEQASWVVPLRELLPAYAGIQTLGRAPEMRAAVTLAGGVVRRSAAYPADPEGWARELGQ